MQRYLRIIMLLAAGLIASCKSTSVPNGPSTSTHGVDPQGNVWMDPPPPQEGLQIALEAFTVPDSAEVQGDFYMHLPTLAPFDVERIEIAMNQGTHHMNLYKWANTWPPDSGVARKAIFRYLEGNIDTMTVRYQAEFNATIVRTDGDMMVEAQVPYLNWTFPKLPDGTQSAVHFGANDTIVIENHYVNGVGSQATPNGMGKVIINLWRATSGPVTRASMMFARKTNLQIPSHTDTIATKDCTLLNNISTLNGAPVYILGITGHFHSRGKRFWVDKMKELVDKNGKFLSDTTIQANVYQSAAWDEPPFQAYDPPIELNLPQGEFLRYHAEYINTTGGIFLFGAHVATQEHMNLFTWFAPSWNNGQTVYDDQN